MAVDQPAYKVQIAYCSTGRPLESCDLIYAHAGHSGWLDKQDVQLTRSEADPTRWEGVYFLPASQLANPSHAEVQLVFKGVRHGWGEAWDNNSGKNWNLVVELAHKEGLVLPALKGGALRTLVSSLLVRLDALLSASLLTAEQFAVLRNKAWAQDFGLIRAYDSVRSVADDHAVASLLLSRFNFLRRPGLHVVHIASEMVPVAKVGGLGDVVTGLAKAHQQSGILCEVVLPKYDICNYAALTDLRVLRVINVEYGGASVPTRVWSGVSEGLPVYLLEPENGFFWRKQFYGANDDLERFMFFSRAALEWLAVSGKQPDIIHLHDWQSAAVAPLLAEEYRARGLSRPRCVFTIHNIAFQGWLSPDFLANVGLDPQRMAQPWHMLDDSRPGFTPGQHDCSLLRGAVVFSDRTTTVSPTYAREAILSQHRHKFSGVLNGIDHESWCPEHDAFLPARFSAAAPAAKEVCKRLLLEELALPYAAPSWVLAEAAAVQAAALNGSAAAAAAAGAAEAPAQPGRPLLAVVSRLTVQKGLPLILHGIKTAIARGAQVVVLGTASEPEVQRQWEDMAREYGRGGDARLVLRYDEGLAHRIYAGADMILIPSFFEPCGLTQLISLRYGTVPIVNHTGGLADTIRDVADQGVPDRDRNGFVFSGRGEAAVEAAVHRAMDAFLKGNEWWRSDLVPRAMQQDWSWSRSAQSYLDLYRGCL
ncbi:hypothetical protein MNEG_2146 [Monoraphidium neglectum]|uniref:starch synthase n=1 Tax=Monoraphidium neglectum TaxID=145388 RepID=A0A0D2NMF9_9CHLO|nr:hypothetical protein MNEG_2146 [Monoraphidium neglectum]KIZ05811.1 hypothetical protein MNEG_2146 [Monoraphidium neglectum]|eukprot:XP_013904830.1 hypothetical protein MNEG_2146 [Monoraphidium neglectum]